MVTRVDRLVHNLVGREEVECMLRGCVTRVCVDRVCVLTGCVTSLCVDRLTGCIVGYVLTGCVC